MKIVVAIFCLLFLSGCVDYHLFMTTQSMAADQNYHLRAMQDYAGITNVTVFNRCEYYAAGMGGFSTTCGPRG